MRLNVGHPGICGVCFEAAFNVETALAYLHKGLPCVAAQQRPDTGLHLICVSNHPKTSLFTGASTPTFPGLL